MPIDNNSSKTPLDAEATDGPIETLQQELLELHEAYTRVHSAETMSPTKANNLTTSSPLYSPTSDSQLGTNTLHVSTWGQPDGPSYVQIATLEKQKPNEPSEQKPGEGRKNDNEKQPLAYIPKAALEAEAQAFAFGAKKYDPWNYKHGIAVTRTLSAALRHIFQFIEGEDFDSESGAHHLGSARANLGMCLDTLANHPGLDDRFKGGGNK